MDILSFNTAEKILASINSPRDLRALALTSRRMSKLIIPRHIQYRKLNIGAENHLALWAHLAKRKDLAKNIRELSMTHVRRRGERCPTTLVPLLEEVQEDGGRANFLQAFQNMERLESFSWRPHKCLSFMDPHRDNKFLDVLSKARCLIKLDLSSTLEWQMASEETSWKDYPIFSFRNLTSLDLRGRFWHHFNDDFSFTSMLLQCPDMEELSMFCTQDPTPFVVCHFPRLRRLTIPNTVLSVEDAVLKFIHEHKTIQELIWDSLNTLVLPGSLPTIQKLLSNQILVMSALQDETVPNRALTSIGRFHLDPSVIEVLEKIDGSQVRELLVCACSDTESIRRIALLFPKVTTLEILDGQGFRLYDECYIDDEILTLSLFPDLECILSAYIWTMISNLEEWEARQDVITKLARACPNLNVLIPSSESQYKIILSRDGGLITWMEVYLDD